MGDPATGRGDMDRPVLPPAAQVPALGSRVDVPGDHPHSCLSNHTHMCLLLIHTGTQSVLPTRWVIVCTVVFEIIQPPAPIEI